MPRLRNALVLLLPLALVVAGCGATATGEEHTSQPATLQPVSGSGLSRVVLTPAAAANIGLRTAPIRLTRVERTLIVRGDVLGRIPGTPIVRVLARLTPAQLRDVDRGKPARILGLGGEAGLVAMPAPTRSGDALEYRLEGAQAAAVRPGRPVRVQITFTDGGMRKVIPYSSVLYWVDGHRWVYTRTAPFTFLRRPVVIDYIAGGVAVLRSGPPVGTTVVRVGAAELLGTEFEIAGE